jgi:transposase InsO family protein
MHYTERLADAGIAPSVGSRGDAYDNAVAESVIGYALRLAESGTPARRSMFWQKI